jgi:hypothetical protein
MTPDRVIVEAIKVAQDLLRQNLPPMRNLTDAATRPFPFDTITSKIDQTKISAVGLGGARQPVRPRASWDGSPLPPVPHLDTMPWLNSGSAIRGPKMDILLGPQLETVGPFLVQPLILATQVWSDLRPRETGIAAQ